MEKINYKLMIDEWDVLVRQGRGDLVRAKLSDLNYKEIPRSFKAKIAELARRILLERESIKILYPIIHNELSQVETASNAEKTEYAAALIEIGSFSEAELLLSGVNEIACPQSLLYYSFLLFKHWNYHLAIPKLRKYIKLERNDYKVIVGEINLASSLVYIGEYLEAELLLNKLIKKSKKLKLSLLTGSCHELLAQVYFKKGEIFKAKINIDLSFSFLKNSNSMALLFLEKWQYLIKREDRSEIENRQQLSKLKLKAKKLHVWETLRDIDKYTAVTSMNVELINKVYYGTSYKAYRSKFLQELKGESRILENYSIGSKSANNILELDTCLYNGTELGIKPGKLIHKLLLTLTSDFYKPFPVGELFSILYSDEYFNPTSSPDKVHKVVKRFRTFFKNKGVDIGVVHENSAYRIEIGDQVYINIKLNQRNAPHNKNIIYLSKLNENEFSSQEAANSWLVSKRTANRILKGSLKENLIIQIGLSSKSKFKKVS